MPSHESAQLTPKQDHAATLLASGMSVKNCAETIDAGLRTVYDWLEKDEFRKLVGQYQAAMVDEALGKLADKAAKAVQTLADCLDSQESDSVKVRAALGILDQLVRIRDTTELERRLTELEGRVPNVDQRSD
jgi:hypothetical protein